MIKKSWGTVDESKKAKVINVDVIDIKLELSYSNLSYKFLQQVLMSEAISKHH